MDKGKKASKFDFNLLKYILQCLKSWKIFLFSVVICVGIGGIYTVLSPPKSQIMAQLMLKDEATTSSMMMGEIARSFSLGDMFGGSSSTDNETRVLSSHSVMEATVRELGLNVSCYRRRFGFNWVFMPTSSPLTLTTSQSISDTISSTLKFYIKVTDDDKVNVKVKKRRSVIAKASDLSLPAKITTPYGDFVVEKTPFFIPEKGGTFRIDFSSYSGAAQSYMDIVKVYVPDRKSDFINISFVTTDAPFGVELVNTVIENYIDEANIYKQERTEQSMKLVDDRLTTLSEELLKSENDLERFKKANGLTDMEVDAQYLMTKTGSLETALLQAQTAYEVVKLTKDFISNPENNYSLIPEIINSTTVGADGANASQITAYNTLILERMQLLNSAKPNSSSVKQLDEKLDAMRANIISSINRMYVNAQVTLRDIKSEDSRTKSRINELPTLERQVLVLMRDNEIQQKMYLFLMQQREELNMNLASRSLPAQVIDAPYVLKDLAGLSRAMVVVLSIFLGCVFAALYVLFFRMRKTPVISGAEIDRLVEAPQMQSLAFDPDFVDSVDFTADNVNYEKMRLLRSDVEFALKGCEGNVVAVTAMNHQEGATFVAANLAASLALAGKRTVIVDAAMRSSHLAQVLGLSSPANTLADFVKSDKVPADVSTVRMRLSDGAWLDVVTSGASTGNAADIVASDRFADLIARLKADYEYVVIDSSPIKPYSDIYQITEVADITLVVCRVRTVSPDDVEALNDLYESQRLKRIAIVKNAVK